MQSSDRAMPGLINSNQALAEQTRYIDIMRSINGTEQFIKAKQAIAAQEKKGGRNINKNINITDINEISGQVKANFMQSYYNQKGIDPGRNLQEITLANIQTAFLQNEQDQNRQSKLKQKQSDQNNINYKQQSQGNFVGEGNQNGQTKYKQNIKQKNEGQVSVSLQNKNLRETVHKFNQINVNKVQRNEQSSNANSSINNNTFSSDGPKE